MKSSNGLFPSLLFALTVRFRICVAVSNALTQYFLESFACISKHRPISTMVRLNRSATPFCCGVSGTVNSCFIFESRQNSLNLFEVYSAPLSVRSVLGVPFSATYSLNLSRTCDLLLVYFTTAYFVYSSMNETAYFDPFKLATSKGPRTSE